MQTVFGLPPAIVSTACLHQSFCVLHPFDLTLCSLAVGNASIHQYISRSAHQHEAPFPTRSQLTRTLPTHTTREVLRALPEGATASEAREGLPPGWRPGISSVKVFTSHAPQLRLVGVTEHSLDKKQLLRRCGSSGCQPAVRM